MTPASPDASGETVDDLLAQLKARVAARERAGEYPPNLEADLDAHFARIAVHRGPGYDLEQLRSRIAALEVAGSFSPEAIPMDTRIPGGSQLHRTVAKVVSRQTQGILAQMQRFADALRGTLWELLAALESPAAHTHTEISGRLDAIFERLASYERAGSATTAIAGLTRRVEALEAAQRWGTSNGRSDALPLHHDLVRHFAGREGLVVDLGCGRGQLLELLLEAGVEATGVEIDADLVRRCVERDLPVEHGDALTWLRTATDGSLGGIALVHVVEHLSGAELDGLVALAARKLRAGGRIVVATTNPQALHGPVRRVAPTHLRTRLEETGFSSIDLEWHAPPATDGMLQPLDGDGPHVDALNANLARLNQLLFAAQDYALVATR